MEEDDSKEASQISKLSYLPDDIIIEILLRSPVRSIGRFRCLSKQFYSLLSDPKFVKKQLELTRRSNTVRRLSMCLRKLFLVSYDSMCVEREYPFADDFLLLSEVTPDPKFKERMSLLTDMHKRWVIDIIGSWNGLVLVTCERARIYKEDDEEVLFYNPTTRECKRLPDLPDQSLPSKIYRKWSYDYGFGFDALTHDYKVMKLMYGKDDHEPKVSVCYVYSLKTDSWRKMTNLLPFYTHLYVSRENLKGAIHWIARTEGGERVLMAFDLEKEEFREMPLPNKVKEFNQHDGFRVDTLKGCLCLVHYSFKMHNVIWVMKEYGLESSWSKISTNLFEYSMKPLWVSKNDDEVLILVDGHLVCRKMKYSGEEFFLKIKAHTYVESLISPNSYGLKTASD